MRSGRLGLDLRVVRILQHLHHDAPVLRLACLGGVFGDRLCLAVTFGLEPRGIHALGDEVVAHRLGAPLREIEVERIGTTAVGVSL